MAVNISSQIVVQTAAEWSVDVTVYSEKRILVTSDVFYTGTDQPRFKFANGVDTWSNLDYIPEGGGANTVAIAYDHSSGNLLADIDDYFVSIGTTMGNTVNSQGLKSIQGGTLVRAYINTYNAGTFGSSENCTVTLFTNGGADSYVFSTTVKFDARHNTYELTGLSEAIVSGESYIVLDTPTFATNPTSAKLSVIIYIEI